jgi:hypothetical protein
VEVSPKIMEEISPWVFLSLESWGATSFGAKNVIKVLTLS